MTRTVPNSKSQRRFVLLVVLFVAAGGIVAGILTGLGSSSSIPSSITIRKASAIVDGKKMIVFVDQANHLLFYNRVDTPYLLACRKPLCVLGAMVPMQVTPTGSVQGIDVTPIPAAAGIDGKCYIEYWGHPIYYDPKYVEGDELSGYPSHDWLVLMPGVVPFSYKSISIPTTPQYRCPA